jgi:hypothetical protein
LEQEQEVKIGLDMRQKMRRIGFRVFLKRKRERAKDKAKPHAAAFSIYSVYLGLNQEIPPGFSCCCLPLSIASQIRGTNILSIGNGNHKIPLSLSLSGAAGSCPARIISCHHARSRNDEFDRKFPIFPFLHGLLVLLLPLLVVAPGGQASVRAAEAERERERLSCLR